MGIELKRYIIVFIPGLQMSLGYGPSTYEISIQNATNSSGQISHRFLKRKIVGLILICLTLLDCPILWKPLNINIAA